ncbi:protein LLP homolog [Eriocheir sinensis]|uniref:protein LLP homolog n=1 Tax=Eriocheir sinensis TaxID=95602 RepID=UPI0021CABA4E|nr:protein LLP homolog [Eriocheir sinensis]
MAKSLRSKWIRKCKKEKRVRYGKKELASLVSLVEKASKNDVVVRDAAEIVREKEVRETTQPSAASGGEDGMEVTTTTTTTGEGKVSSVKAIINKTGTAPKWLHPRKLKKNKIIKKKNAKAGKQKYKFKG